MRHPARSCVAHTTPHTAWPPMAMPDWLNLSRRDQHEPLSMPLVFLMTPGIGWASLGKSTPLAVQQLLGQPPKYRSPHLHTTGRPPNKKRINLRKARRSPASPMAMIVWHSWTEVCMLLGGFSKVWLQTVSNTCSGSRVTSQVP